MGEIFGSDCGMIYDICLIWYMLFNIQSDWTELNHYLLHLKSKVATWGILMVKVIKLRNKQKNTKAGGGREFFKNNLFSPFADASGKKYWCFYQHWWRDLVSPVCRIFSHTFSQLRVDNWEAFINTVFWYILNSKVV